MKNTSFFHTIYWNSNSNKNQHQNQYQIEPDAHTHTSTMGYKEQYIRRVKGFNLFFVRLKMLFWRTWKRKYAVKVFNIKSVIDWKPKEIEGNELRWKKEGRGRKSATTVHVELFCQ